MSGVSTGRSGRRLLVIGGGGFIGERLVRSRLEAGDEVHVLAKPTSALDRLSGLGRAITAHRVAPGDGAALHDALSAARPDAVVYLASATRRPDAPDFSDAAASVSEDLQPLLAMVQAAAVLPHPPRAFVRAGTLAEYGFADRAHAEDDAERPADSYAAAMLAGTRYLAMLQPRLPFAVVTARLSLTYGPGQSERFFIPAALRACVERQPILLRRPDDARDLIHVDDVVRGLEMLCAHPVRGAIVNLASGEAPPMREVARLILRVAGAPSSLLREDRRPASAPPTRLRGRWDKAARRWGFRTRITLETGLAMTLDAVRAGIVAS